jgi:alcohol dehydrogenase
MDKLIAGARDLLRAWKGDAYVFGRGVLSRSGPLAAAWGKRALLVCNTTRMKSVADTVAASLGEAGLSLSGAAVISGAAPNTPH